VAQNDRADADVATLIFLPPRIRAGEEIFAGACRCGQAPQATNGFCLLVVERLNDGALRLWSEGTAPGAEYFPFPSISRTKLYTNLA